MNCSAKYFHWLVENEHCVTGALPVIVDTTYHDSQKTVHEYFAKEQQSVKSLSEAWHIVFLFVKDSRPCTGSQLQMMTFMLKNPGSSFQRCVHDQRRRMYHKMEWQRFCVYWRMLDFQDLGSTRCDKDIWICFSIESYCWCNISERIGMLCVSRGTAVTRLCANVQVTVGDSYDLPTGDKWHPRQIVPARKITFDRWKDMREWIGSTFIMRVEIWFELPKFNCLCCLWPMKNRSQDMLGLRWEAYYRTYAELSHLNRYTTSISVFNKT